MTEPLGRDDWERIAHALSHFSHNTEYQTTLAKVRTILGAG